MFRFKLDRNRKYILIVAAGLLVLGLVYRFYPFFEGMLSPKAELELKMGRIVKYQKRLKSESGLKTSVENLKGALTKAEEGLLTGKTPVLTAVQIQEILQKITEKSGVVIGRLQVLNPEESEKDGYLSVPVEFYIDATISQLKEVLYRISVFQKYLTVTKLRIDYATRGASGSIRCEMIVAGYMKGMKG